MDIHPIEQESYRIMRSEIDFSSWTQKSRAIVERLVHASSDAEYATSARLTEEAVEQGIIALRNNPIIVADAHMVRVGIVHHATMCLLDEIPKPSPEPGVTRSALALRAAIKRYPRGAIFVIGNAPTALFELLDHAERGTVEPALVIGLPVGFVGAAESKQALWESSLQDRCITNKGRKGGSAVAAATLNALSRLALEKC
jgi:precorrin-8X/cobalt-precorrin-8 methylmutase